jgi:hypothetical protein
MTLLIQLPSQKLDADVLPDMEETHMIKDVKHAIFQDVLNALFQLNNSPMTLHQLLILLSVLLVTLDTT